MTLPDYLRPGLSLVFVGINPGLYSARQGHYFARRSSRFWPAFSRSRLSAGIRTAFGRDLLGPDDDWRLPEFGIGLTDLVKRPTANAAELSAAEFAGGALALRAKLDGCRPRIVCFHGVTSYRAFSRAALAETRRDLALGLQPARLGPILLYVTPNPSPANAHYRAEDYVSWYDRLADLLASAADR